MILCPHDITIFPLFHLTSIVYSKIQTFFGDFRQDFLRYFGVMARTDTGNGKASGRPEGPSMDVFFGGKRRLLRGLLIMLILLGIGFWS